MKGKKQYLLIIAITIAIIYTFVPKGNPVIKSVNPNVAEPGDIIEIRGRGFGKERGRVIIGDMELLNSSFIIWSDKLIKAKLPLGVSSGFVKVFTARNRKSNSILFALSSDIPKKMDDAVVSAEIAEVNPVKVSFSSPVNITGSNLGIFKDKGAIYVTWLGKDLSKNNDNIFYRVPDDYISKWTDDEIEFFLPEAASSGEIFISDGEKRTNGVFIEVDYHAGRFNLGTPVTYSLEFDMGFNLTASDSGAAIVWMPGVLETFWQRDINILEESVPYYIKDKGRAAYRFSKTQTIEINNGVVCDVYPVWISDVDERMGFSSYEKERYAVWLKDVVIDKSSNLLAPLFDGKTYSPYEWLWKSYVFVRDNIGYNKTASNSISSVISSGISDSLGRAKLLVQLLRAGGVPARVAGGLLLQSGGNLAWYYWAEAVLPSMGWIPVDPTAPYEALTVPSESEKTKDLYFMGGLSSQHLLMFREGDDFPVLIPGSERHKDNAFPALWDYCYELRNSSISDMFFDMAVAGVYQK